jgi:hypothetical protein
MRRWKLRCVLAGLAVGLVAVVAFVAWPRPDPVRMENFHVLRVGMSKPEVYAVLGVPGEYLTSDSDYDDDGVKELGQAPHYSHKEGVEVWKGDQAVFWVQFDTAGHVSGATCIPLRLTDHGPLGNLLWRIKYQLWKWFP